MRVHSVAVSRTVLLSATTSSSLSATAALSVVAAQTHGGDREGYLRIIDTNDDGRVSLGEWMEYMQLLKRERGEKARTAPDLPSTRLPLLCSARYTERRVREEKGQEATRRE